MCWQKEKSRMFGSGLHHKSYNLKHSGVLPEMLIKIPGKLTSGFALFSFFLSALRQKHALEHTGALKQHVVACVSEHFWRPVL